MEPKVLVLSRQILNPEPESCIVTTCAPKVCKIMAFMAIIMRLGLLFYIRLGFRKAQAHDDKFL